MEPRETIAGCEIWPVTSDLVVRARDDDFHFGEETARRIDELWEAERARRPHAFDAPLFTVEAFRDGGVTGRYMRYREYLALREEPELAPGGAVPASLGVSGLLVAGGRVVLARRAKHVWQYPGMLELVPSGVVDAAHRAENGTIDFRAQILDELFEEVGVARDHITAVQPFALVFDSRIGTFDIAIELRTELSATDIEHFAQTAPHDEYEGIRMVPIEGLNRFVAENRRRIIPLSLAMLKVAGYIDETPMGSED
ncbi:hypothetical protein K8I61_00255 [bacterium]|nr:hypothetical protein [bacterium]